MGEPPRGQGVLEGEEAGGVIPVQLGGGLAQGADERLDPVGPHAEAGPRASVVQRRLKAGQRLGDHRLPPVAVGELGPEGEFRADLGDEPGRLDRIGVGKASDPGDGCRRQIDPAGILPSGHGTGVAPFPGRIGVAPCARRRGHSRRAR